MSNILVNIVLILSISAIIGYISENEIILTKEQQMNIINIFEYISQFLKLLFAFSH